MERYIKLDKIEPLPIDTIKSDDVIGDAQKTLEEWISEAYFKAIHEGIKANTVMISEHFAKVNEFPLTFGMSTTRLPPMICGLQVYVSRDLPDGYDFGLVEVPVTEREHIIKNAEAEVARDILEMLEADMCLYEREYRPFNSSEYVKYYDIGLRDAIIGWIKDKYNVWPRWENEEESE